MAGKHDIPSPLRGFIIDNIQLGQQIGRGANGRILEAKWEGATVAVKEIPRGPTPTGIQHKSFRIPIGIWNLDEESEILSKMESSKIDSNSVISPHFHITPHIEAI